MSNAVRTFSPCNYSGQLSRLMVPTCATQVKRKTTKPPPPKLKLPNENIKTLPQSSHLLISERYSSFGVKL